MDQRTKFLEDWWSHRMTRTALCRLYGISRPTGYKWARRSKKGNGPAEKSRRPLHSPNATPPHLVKLIVSQKKQFPLWGPVPIRKRLQTQWPQHQWPSVSTIGAVLKRNGLVKARRKRMRAAPRTQPFSKCREPNDVWCVDFKGHFTMGNGRVCYPLTVKNVWPIFVELFRRYGLPKAIRSDNGEPFASVSTAAGLTQLSAWWAKLGIALERIDPGEPQQNGRHERMHLTLKQATCSPPRRSLGWQQRAFDQFCAHYNEVRPHQGIELATPHSLYVESKRRYLEQVPECEYPFADVHRVRPDGTIRFNQRKQFITTSLAGELVGLHALDERYVEVHYANLILGLIDTRNGNINPRYVCNGYTARPKYRLHVTWPMDRRSSVRFP